MKRLIALLTLFFLSFLFSGLLAQEAKGDLRFINKALMGHLFEVSLGKIAVQKSTNADVKDFAQKMVDEHTKLNNELLNIAQKNNVTAPAGLDKEHQKMLDKVSEESGKAFDKEYMKTMIKVHKKDIGIYSGNAASADDPDIRDYAGRALPALQQHLKLAKDIKEKL